MIKKVLFLLLISWVNVHSQNTTLIHGKIISQEKESIFVSFYPTALKLQKSNLVFEINENGEFKVDLPIEEAQVVKLELNHEPIYVFIEPEEKLGLLIEQINFVSEVQYFDKNGELDNFIYDEYNSKFDQTDVVFTSSIASSKKLLAQLGKRPSVEKFAILKAQFDSEMNFFKESKKRNLSDPFSHFLENEIRSKFLGRLILYIEKNELPTNLAKEFTSYISKGTKGQQSNNTIHYNAYLYLYATFLCQENSDKELDYFQDFTQLYHCIHASEKLDQRTKEKVLGWLIYYNCRPQKARELSPLFHHYKQFVEDKRLLDKVQERFVLAASLQDGQVAPAFNMIDKFGNQVSLSAFKGKKVHISVWAQWCGLCKEGIVKSEENRKSLASETIEFLFISIDKKIETWEAHPVTNEQKGIHLWGGDLTNGFINDYGIISLPRTFLLDEKGQFITEFPAYDTEEFIDFIISH